MLTKQTKQKRINLYLSAAIIGILILAGCSPAGLPSSGTIYDTQPAATAAPTVAPTQALPVTGNAAGDDSAEIKVSQTADLGNFLVDSKGMTLYLFTKDTPDKSNCSGECLVNWPPLLTAKAPKADDGVDASKLGTITLADGTLQVTYDHWPLYYFIADKKAGDVLGQNVGGVWFVVPPASSAAAPTEDPNYGKDNSQSASSDDSAELKVSSSADLGSFLVDENGMTLYLFTKDTPGVSNCSGKCLVNWPAFTTVKPPKADDGVDASKLGTITRDDGTLQVTYDNMPLYYYIKDLKAGDTTGQNVGEVWFVVPPSPAGASGSSDDSAELKVSSTPDLGNFLVDSNGMTLYLFTKDVADKSNCAGQCLVNWPPFLTEKAPKADDGVDQSKLGTITLADGSLQVTYDHMPLYYYIGDKKAGDVAGQNVGKVWFVVAP